MIFFSQHKQINFQYAYCTHPSKTQLLGMSLTRLFRILVQQTDGQRQSTLEFLLIWCLDLPLLTLWTFALVSNFFKVLHIVFLSWTFLTAKDHWYLYWVCMINLVSNYNSASIPFCFIVTCIIIGSVSNYIRRNCSFRTLRKKCRYSEFPAPNAGTYGPEKLHKQFLCSVSLMYEKKQNLD